MPVTILGNNWIFGHGLSVSGTFLISDVSDGYWGPNLGISPELVTFVLLGTGVLGLAAGLRRKLNIQTCRTLGVTSAPEFIGRRLPGSLSIRREAER